MNHTIMPDRYMHTKTNNIAYAENDKKPSISVSRTQRNTKPRQINLASYAKMKLHPIPPTTNK